MAPEVEAQAVEAKGGETWGERLVFERVEADAAEQYEGRRVVGAMPQPPVEIQIPRTEANGLGITLHGRPPPRRAA